MTEKPSGPRGRPIKNTVDPIPAPADKIARAIFKAADKKITPPKKSKKKPN